MCFWKQKHPLTKRYDEGGERLRILGNLGRCVCANTQTHTLTIGVQFSLIKRITLCIPIAQDEDHAVFSEDILSGISGGASLEVHRFIYTPLMTTASHTCLKVTLCGLVVFSSRAFILFRIYSQRVNNE